MIEPGLIHFLMNGNNSSLVRSWQQTWKLSICQTSNGRQNAVAFNSVSPVVLPLPKLTLVDLALNARSSDWLTHFHHISLTDFPAKRKQTTVVCHVEFEFASNQQIRSRWAPSAQKDSCLHKQASYLSSLRRTTDVFWPGWFSDNTTPTPHLKLWKKLTWPDSCLHHRLYMTYPVDDACIHQEIDCLFTGWQYSCQQFLVGHLICFDDVPVVAGCPLIHNSRLTCRLLTVLMLWPL